MSEKPNHPAQLGSNLGHIQSFPDHPLLPVKSPHTLNQSFHTLPTPPHTNLYKVLHVLGREGQDTAVDSLGWASETDWRPNLVLGTDRDSGLVLACGWDSDLILACDWDLGLLVLETGLVLAPDWDSLLESESDLDLVLETESDSNLMLAADLDLDWVLPANGSDEPDLGWATDTVELMLATDLVD